MAHRARRQADKHPLFLGIDVLAAIIVALLLWLLPMNAWSYGIASFVLAALACAFIWLVPMLWLGNRRIAAKVGMCVLAIALLGAVLVPEGFARFNSDKTAQSAAQAPTSSNTKGTITAPNNQGIITQGQTGGSNTIINPGIPDRHLRPEQQAALAETMKPACRVTIKHVNATAAQSDHEAQAYALEFVGELRSAGCTADLAVPTPGLRPDITAVHIGIRKSVTDDAQIPTSAKVLGAALKAAEVPYTFEKMEDDFFPEEQFVLVIGSNR
jgi:hypothetical protein